MPLDSLVYVALLATVCLSDSRSPPAYPLSRSRQVISRVVAAAGLPASLVSMMDRTISEFHKILGSSERLLRAPIPLAYTRHTSRFLIIWLTLLPLALCPALGMWWSMASMAIISFLILGT